ncbi:MAG: LemA family protein [Sphingobacteriales bacterium]|nr:MAG: LemA family protein [Sphingobacteriales bacterium]
MGKKGTFIFLGLVLILAIFFITSYNGFVKKEEQVKLAWSEMQNNYQRRTDLVPNLVAIVQGSANFEKQTLEQIAAARAKATQLLGGTASYDNYTAQEKAQGDLANTMNRLIAQVEAYPELKTTQSFIGLQTQLEGTERRIKVARKDFNEQVNQYNQSVRKFPSNLAAKLFGFKEKEGFKADIGADKSPEVKFNFSK